MRARKRVGPPLRPTIHVALPEIRILEQAPEPWILLVIEWRPIPVFGFIAVFALRIPETEVPIPNRFHLDLAAAILREKCAESETIDVLRGFDEKMLIDERIN